MRRSYALACCLLGLACDKDEGPDPEAVAKEAVAAALETELAAAKEERDKLLAAQEELKKTIAGQNEMLVALEGSLAGIEASHAKLEEIVAEVQSKPEPAPAADPTVALGTVYKVELGEAQTRGDDTALVTIVQYSDFECPHCGFVGTTLDALEKKYGRDVRFAFKHFPLTFHKQARSAAIAAEAAAEQDKFWEMHDKLFENMRDLSDKNYVKWARELGLDVKQFKKDIANPDIGQRVDDMKKSGEELGLMGTPSFFVNGRQVEGGHSEPEFSALIDEELVRARALVGSGTSPSKVYEEAIKSGKTRLEPLY